MNNLNTLSSYLGMSLRKTQELSEMACFACQLGMRVPCLSLLELRLQVSHHTHLTFT